jgi:hypothetical protein
MVTTLPLAGLLRISMSQPYLQGAEVLHMIRQELCQPGFDEPFSMFSFQQWDSLDLEISV